MGWGGEGHCLYAPKLLAARSWVPQGKGLWVFFFFLSSQLGEVFYLKGEKAAMQWLFPLLPGPRKAAPADLPWRESRGEE